MNQIQENVIIRQRGQLTIPIRIRKRCKWLTPGSVVTLIVEGTDHIIIRPYKPA